MSSFSENDPEIGYRTEPKTSSSGDALKEKVYIARRSKGAGAVSIFAGALTAYIAFLCTIYGLLSFSRPELVTTAFENKGPLAALVFGAGTFLLALSTKLVTLGGSTFERTKSDDSLLGFPSSIALAAQRVIQLATGSIYSINDGGEREIDKEEVKETLLQLQSDSFSYGAASSDGPFETYISNILKSLSTYAASSENTANKLLDKGVAFMAGGLVFYVLAIVVWQIFANLTHPDSLVMYVGMAACSMTFIVVEFLAAWFFKQYRYYVEVSLSCLRVRSVYDRYLLGYYALREFKGNEDETVRNQMVEMLKEDVNWPSYKKGVANDFNYMIDSMSAAHTSLEKMKGVFQVKKKLKVAADQ